MPMSSVPTVVYIPYMRRMLLDIYFGRNYSYRDISYWLDLHVHMDRRTWMNLSF